ncbi:beta-alanyl-bioamine nonribosomal peptide synthetase ebony-like [Saccoglossus kowalevskii]
MEDADKTAVIYRSSKLIFSQLNKKSNAMALVIRNTMKTFKCNTSSTIGLHLHPSDDVIILIFAILKLGFSYLPLDPSYPLLRLRHMIGDANPVCVITESSKTGLQFTPNEVCSPTYLLLVDLQKRMVEFDDNVPTETDQCQANNTDAAACVLYTSGSTGVPKGVIKSHRNILSRCRALWDSFTFSKTEVVCWIASLNFVDSTTQLFGFLLKGLPVVVADRSTVVNSELFIQFLNIHAITWILLVPTQLKTMLNVLRVKSADGKQILKSHIRCDRGRVD